MQVILKADVDHLGYALDVVEVKKGYWRNYLRPRGLAETATPERVSDLTARMERRRAAEARNETEAAELRDLLARTVLTIPAHAGPQGKLFGSVGTADIARAIESARKLRLDPKRIKLDEPIKALGTFMVPVEVFAGVTAEIKTMVVESKATEDELARMQIDADAAEQAEKVAEASAAAAAAAQAHAEANPQESAAAEAAAQAEAAHAELARAEAAAATEDAGPLADVVDPPVVYADADSE